MKVLYKNRKGRVLTYDERNWDIEPGDILVDGFTGKAYRAEVNSSEPTRNAGILYPRKLKPPFKDAKAIIEDGRMYWVSEWSSPLEEVGK